MSERDPAGEVFRSELLPGETILWSGQPDPATHFTGADAFLIPFSILWAGFALFWEALVVLQLIITRQAPAIGFSLWGIPFVMVGCYITFGRFIYKAARKRRTYYAVTDKRVLILTHSATTSIQSRDLDSISTINKSMRANGVGTLTFGYSGYPTSLYANTGMDLFGWGRTPGVPTFYDIKDAEAVYRRINQLKQAA